MLGDVCGGAVEGDVWGGEVVLGVEVAGVTVVAGDPPTVVEGVRDRLPVPPLYVLLYPLYPL